VEALSFLACGTVYQMDPANAISLIHRAEALHLIRIF
jgi:hypothetical protein